MTTHSENYLLKPIATLDEDALLGISTTSDMLNKTMLMDVVHDLVLEIVRLRHTIEAMKILKAPRS